MPLNPEANKIIDQSPVKRITKDDFKTEMFDGLPLKRHIPREITGNPDSYYYHPDLKELICGDEK